MWCFISGSIYMHCVYCMLYIYCHLCSRVICLYIFLSAWRQKFHDSSIYSDSQVFLRLWSVSVINIMVLWWHLSYRACNSPCISLVLSLCLWRYCVCSIHLYTVSFCMCISHEWYSYMHGWKYSVWSVWIRNVSLYLYTCVPVSFSLMIAKPASVPSVSMLIEC